MTKEEKTASAAAYYLLHREELMAKRHSPAELVKKKAYNKAYCDVHREELKALARAYREPRRQERAAQARDWYALTADERRAQKKSYRQNNPEKVRAACLVSTKKQPVKRKLNGINAAAKRRGCKGILMLEEFRDLIRRVCIDVVLGTGGRCPACERDFAAGTKRRWTFDHVIPISQNGLHTKDNGQIICWSCNDKKGNQTVRYSIPEVGSISGVLA